MMAITDKETKSLHSRTERNMKVNPLDSPIIATADDAVLAKRAAVAAGYYDDPFVEAISVHASGLTSAPTTHTKQARDTPSNSPFQQQGGRRMDKHQQPIIKRGTHARVCCIDRAISAFASLSHKTKERQVVVLGAGKDTNYFRYRAGLLLDISSESFTSNQPHNPLQWFEVDHPSVIRSKVKIIESAPTILTSQTPALELHKSGDDEYVISDSCSSSSCFLVGHDLRSPPDELIKKFSCHNFDPMVPTLFVLECVQMYLPDVANAELLRHLSQCCPNACVVLFDPILGNDPFGKMMERNLLRAGVVTQDSCLLRARTLSDHMTNIVSYGFDRIVGCDMMSAYETIVTAGQRHRANQCEMLDEVEEWVLIMQHYCFMVCCRSTSDFGLQYCRVGPSSSIGFVSERCSVIDNKTKRTEDRNN